jgi:mRNA interferase MazF
MAYAKGSLVLVPFPFTDLSSSRVRPALVVSSDEYNGSGDDLIVAMVTGQARRGAGDCRLLDWQSAGLAHPSWVRAKLATLDERLVQFSPGRLSARDVVAVEARLRWALGFRAP